MFYRKSFFWISVLSFCLFCFAREALAGRTEWHINAFRAGAFITIDGVVDKEWRGAEVVYINVDGKYPTEDKRNLDPADSSGTLLTLWDDTYFYAAFLVADDAPLIPAPDGWRSDDPGLYFDTKNDGGDNMAADDTMFHFPYIGNEIGKGEYKAWFRFLEGQANSTFSDNVVANDVKLGWKQVEQLGEFAGKLGNLSGYILEVAVPFDPYLYGLKPKEGTTIGFAWHIYDAEAVRQLDTVFRWPEDLSWIPPKDFGTLTFSSRVTAVNSKQKLTTTWGRLKF